MTDHSEGQSSGEIRRGTARIFSASALRDVLSTGLAVVASAVVAHALGPASFGRYAGGTAAFYLALQLTDLGFATVLARELARRSEEEGRLVRATVELQLLWSAAIALGLVALALASGGTRGTVMLVLAPAVLVNGVSAARQVFTVRFRAAPLLLVDLVTAVFQSAALIVLAELHAGPVLLAVALGTALALNVVGAAALARGVVGRACRLHGDRRRILRMALPVGVVSVLSSLYFTIDQVLLGWLVSSRELGHYAAAVRFLTALVAIPSLVMAAGIPGLARSAGDREELSQFAGTLSHWLAATALPLAAGLAVFAARAVGLVFGASYAESAGLLRVLMLAGGLSLVSNVLAMTLISASILRRMVWVNLLSLAVNVAGNFALVPSQGVMASAWLTVLSEVIVIAYGVWALRHHLRYGAVLGRFWRAFAAAAAGSAAGLAVGPGRVVAIPVSALVWLAVMAALRGWPSELLPSRLRRLGTPAPLQRRDSL